MDIQEAAERDADAEEARFEKEVARMKKIMKKWMLVYQLKAETTRLEALKVKFDSQRIVGYERRQVEAGDGTLSTPKLSEIYSSTTAALENRKKKRRYINGRLHVCKIVQGLPRVNLMDSAKPAECDLIFATAKKLERRLGFSHFLAALNLVAAKRYPNKTRDGAFDALLTDHVLKLPTVRLTSKRASMRTPSIVALIEPKIRLPGEKENRFFRF